MTPADLDRDLAVLDEQIQKLTARIQEKKRIDIADRRCNTAITYHKSLRNAYATNRYVAMRRHHTHYFHPLLSHPGPSHP